MDLAVGVVQGLEEAEPLDMVHVEMGQQQVDSSFPAANPGPQSLNSRARVEDD
jgi:hypothetical protein